MKIKNDELTELLSYPASKEQRMMILKEVKETGKSIAEVADKYAMPPLMVKDERITAAERKRITDHWKNLKTDERFVS